MNDNADILLVEDNEFDAEMAVWSLKRNNMGNVVHVDTGVKAIEYLQGTGNYAGRDVSVQPKAVLLDMRIGGISGIKVLEQIRAGENTKNIPVYIVTGSADAVDMERCSNLGIEGYLVKPINFDHLSKNILQPLLNENSNADSDR